MLFCDPHACFINQKCWLLGRCCPCVERLFIRFILIYFFLINTRFGWHLFWQIFGLQPGTRGYRPAEELSCGSKPQLVRTTLVRSHQDPSSLWDKPPTSPCCLFPLLCIPEALRCRERSFVGTTGPALLLEKQLCSLWFVAGTSASIFISPLPFNSSALDWRMGLQGGM